MTQPLIYLAGPYSAPDQWGREQHVLQAQCAAAMVLSSGALPVYTHAAYHCFWGRYPEEVFITLGKALLAPCHGVWCYAGHERSTMSNGTVGEILEAERLGIPCGYDLPALLAKVKARAA